MPKIPTFKARGQITTETPSVQTTLTAPSMDIAGDIQSSIAKYYVAEKKEEAKIKSAEYENESWNELYSIYDKHKSNPYPTDATNLFNKDAEAYKQNFLNTRLANESKFTKNAWLEKFESNRSSTLLALNKTSRNNLENKKLDELNNFAATLSTKIRLNDSFIPKVDLEIDNYVNQNYEDKFVREQNKNFLIKMKEETILDKRSKSDPLNLLNELSQNPNLYPNAPEATEKAVSFSRSVLRQNGEKLLKEKLEASYMGEDTGVDSNLIASSFIGQKNFLQIKEELQVADLVRDNVKTVLYSNSNIALDLIKDLDIKTTDENLKQKTINKLQSIIENKQNIIDTEGGAEYFSNSYSSVKSSYEDYKADPNQTNLKIYTEKLDKIYEDEDIDPIYRTYLNNNDIDTINNQIDAADNPERKLAIIEGLKQSYGDKFADVHKQLNGKVDFNLLFTASVTSPTLKKYSSEGKLNDDQKKNLASRLNETSASTLEASIIADIQDETEDFYNILLSQGSGRIASPGDVMDPIITTMKDATLQLLQSGRSDNISDAVKTIAGEFLRDYDLSNGNFYIPYSIGEEKTSFRLVEGMASIIKSDIKYGKIDLNDYDLDLFGEGGKKTTADQTISLIRSSGDWYMDSNKGLIFGVTVPNGKFYEVRINDPKNPNKKIPLTIDFLNRDGKTNFISKSGVPLSVDLTEINSYVSAADVYEMQQEFSP